MFSAITSQATNRLVVAAGAHTGKLATMIIPISFLAVRTLADAAAAPRPSRRRTTADRDPIIVTDRAAERIQDLLASKKAAAAGDSNDDEPLGIRLGVRRRGCNGLSYTLNYVHKNDDNVKKDITMESKGVKLWIEPMALFNVVGTTMDWEETELASEFTFSNPNSKGECGCGESFVV